MSFRVLIVDDNMDKAREVAKGICEIQGYDPENIVTVSTATDAKRALRADAFDLVVLDIMLPARADQDPAPAGGLELLSEVLSRDVYVRPRHIVGLTAYEDTYRDAAARFGNELWSVVLYDATSEAWLEQIKAKARHIAISETERAAAFEFGCDLCVVAALQDPELDAVLRLPWAWRELPVTGDATVYYEGRFSRVDGRAARVVAARAPLMGMAAAAILTTKMAMRFRPRLIGMPGICAGAKGEVELGDVIVANPTWDYGSGKHSVKSGAQVFAPAPQQIGLTSRLRGLVERIQADNQALGAIRQSYPGQKPGTILKVHIGPLASGAAVLADSTLFAEVAEQHRKLLGVDMEAYGVMAAATEVPSPEPEVVVVKGVSDFADEKKDDRFRHYAAHASAEVLRLIVERMPR